MQHGAWTLLREKVGTLIAPVVADATPPAALTRGVNTRGYETAIVGVIIEGGVTPTVDVIVFAVDSGEEMLFPVADENGLSSGDSFSFPTYGARLLVQINAVTSVPTRVALRITPGTKHGG